MELTTAACHQIVPRRSTRVGVKGLSSLWKVRLCFNRKPTRRFKSYYYPLFEKKRPIPTLYWPISILNWAAFLMIYLSFKTEWIICQNQKFFCSGNSQSLNPCGCLYMYQLYSWIKLITWEGRHIFKIAVTSSRVLRCYTVKCPIKRFITQRFSLPETNLLTVMHARSGEFLPKGQKLSC